MESKDRELIFEIMKQDFQLRKLYKQHEEFERRLSRFENRPYLTTPEELEAKRLKRAKLGGVDAMMRIISVHRTQQNGSQNSHP